MKQLIEFSARQTEEAYICIHEAAMILENLSAALQTVEEAPYEQAAAVMAMANRPCLNRGLIVQTLLVYSPAAITHPAGVDSRRRPSRSRNCLQGREKL